jgi:hypothetical protein
MKLAAYAGFTVGAVLVLALASLPYGYYTFLRLAVFVVGGFFGFEMYENGVLAGAIGYVLVALLFNPFVPVHLTRAIWLPIDLLAAIAFTAGSAFLLFRARQQQSGSTKREFPG